MFVCLPALPEFGFHHILFSRLSFQPLSCLLVFCPLTASVPWNSILSPFLFFYFVFPDESHCYSSLSLYLCTISSNIYISNANHPIIALEPTACWPPTSWGSRATKYTFKDFNILPNTSLFSIQVLYMNWKEVTISTKNVTAASSSSFSNLCLLPHPINVLVHAKWGPQITTLATQHLGIHDFHAFIWTYRPPDPGLEAFEFVYSLFIFPMVRLPCALCSQLSKEDPTSRFLFQVFAQASQKPSLGHLYLSITLLPLGIIPDKILSGSLTDPWRPS